MHARFLTLAAFAATFAAVPAVAQTDTASAPVPADSPSTPRTDAPTPRTPHARRNINLITYEEVRNSRYSDAYDVVHHLRPAWLRSPRGATSAVAQIDLAVFLDGVRLGSRESLHNIPINSVRSLRFFSAIDARQRFGGDTSMGAIEIYSH
jgi:hypothetical protein